MNESDPTERDVILLILTYNHEDCIQNTINDIKAQSHSNYKVYLVDDASSDNTYQIAEETVAGDKRFILKRNIKNLGVFQNLTQALETIKKEQKHFRYFAWIGSDDRYKKLWLKANIKLLEENSSFGISQSYVEYDYGSKREIREYQSIDKSNLGDQDYKLIRLGYGQIIHSIWKYNTFSFVDEILGKLKANKLLKLENFFISALIANFGLIIEPRVLHTKNKYSGSKQRYKNNKFFQDPNKQFVTWVSSIPGMIRIIQTSRNKRFIGHAALLDLRISFPSRIRK